MCNKFSKTSPPVRLSAELDKWVSFAWQLKRSFHIKNFALTLVFTTLLTLSGIRRRPAPLLCCIPMRHSVSLFFLTAIASSFLGVKNMWPRECHKPQDVIKVTLFNRIVSNFHRKKSLKDRHIFWTPLSFLTPSSFQPMVGVICSAPHPRGHFSIDMWYMVSGF